MSEFYAAGTTEQVTQAEINWRASVQHTQPNRHWNIEFCDGPNGTTDAKLGAVFLGQFDHAKQTGSIY